MSYAVRLLRVRLQAWVPFLVLAVGLSAGLGDSQRFPTGDAPHIVAIAQKLSAMVGHGEFMALYESLSSLVSPHPPAGYALVMALDLLGFSDLPMAVSFVALALTWHGMLLMVRREGRPTWGPWLGGLVMSTSGALWFAVDQMTWDLLAMGCVSACVGHLHGSDGLRKLGHSLFFGLFMAAGFLTKYTFPGFLLLPVLFAGWAVVRFRSLPGLGVALGAFFVVAGPWYWGHLGPVLAYVAHSSDAAATLSASPATTWIERFSAGNLLFYPTVLRDMFGWPGLGLMALGAIRAWESPAGRWALWGVVGGGIVLTFAGENQSRYILPALPLLAVMVDTGFRPGFIQTGSRFGLVAGLCTALPAAWGTWMTYGERGDAPPARDQSHSAESLMTWGDWPWVSPQFRPVSNPLQRWRVDEALGAMAMATGPGAHQVGLSLPPDVRLPPSATYAWRAGLRGLQWDFASVVTDGPQRRPMIFVGPLKPLGKVISRRFSVAYAVFPRGKPPQWAQELSATSSWQHDLPDGYVGAVLEVPAEGWRSPLGTQLLKDPIDG